MANAIGQCLVGLTTIAGEHVVHLSGGSTAIASSSGALSGAFLLSGRSLASCDSLGSLVLKNGFSGASIARASSGGRLIKTLNFSGDGSPCVCATSANLILLRYNSAWIIDFPDDSLYPSIVVSEAVTPTPTNTISFPELW